MQQFDSSYHTFTMNNLNVTRTPQVLVKDTAYFRSFTAPELIAAAKKVKDASLELHVCEVVGRIPSSHRNMIESGFARFLRVYVHSWHKKASLRMGVVVTPSLRKSKTTSFRCVKGCVFDVCTRCAEMSRLREDVFKEISVSHLGFQSNKIKDAIVDFSILASTSTSLSRHIAMKDEADRIALSMRRLGISSNDASCHFALALSSSCTNVSKQISARRVRRAISHLNPNRESVIQIRIHTSRNSCNETRKHFSQVLQYMNTDVNPQLGFLSRLIQFSTLASSSNTYVEDGVNRRAELLKPFQILAKTRDVVQLRSLRQKSDNTCGYYALYNAVCVLRCLRDLIKNKKRYCVLSNLLQMYDRDEFENWKKEHQSTILRACETYYWNAKAAKAGILGSNEANFLILTDPILSSSSRLVCMSNFGDLELNSAEQVCAIDKLLREISSSSEHEIRIFVLGAHDHWYEMFFVKNKILEQTEHKHSFYPG